MFEMLTDVERKNQQLDRVEVGRMLSGLIRYLEENGEKKS